MTEGYDRRWKAGPEGALKGVRSNQYFHQGLMNKEKDLINGLPPTINNKHYCSTKERYFLSLARSKSHSSQYFRGWSTLFGLMYGSVLTCRELRQPVRTVLTQSDSFRNIHSWSALSLILRPVSITDSFAGSSLKEPFQPQLPALLLPFIG